MKNSYKINVAQELQSHKKPILDKVVASFSLDFQNGMDGATLHMLGDLIDYIASLLVSNEDDDKSEHMIPTTAEDSKDFKQPLYSLTYLRRQMNAWWEDTAQSIDTDETNANDVRQLMNDAIDATYIQHVTDLSKNLHTQFEESTALLARAPVALIPLNDATAICPLVGHIDKAYARRLLEQTVEKCRQMRVKHLVIDVSGVHSIQPRYLVDMANALDTIGVYAVLTGMSSTMSIELAVNPTELQFLHFERTLAVAIEKLGQK
ncbi:STAS domain-containing protein [Aureibacillus halotolerans]|uniref:Anti-anti-sigma regulatory factor n=1 Tax=Aureibacillus halotolerans TaxID=1508390 RepID=A0A4R6TXA4_9BACI|nr:STAS domain-containing protein [Aureibacillus halotolerans]TDQ37402.1 anti-anti-sigma regulatory factor [Aureibacillus halotolerans]